MKPETARDPPVPAETPPRHKWLFFPRPVAWVVLAISLVATAGGWFIAWQHAELTARKRFDEEAGRITAALEERMQIYEDVLHGAVGLLAASCFVIRDMKIIKGTTGYFVAMPAKKMKDGTYRDLMHPLDKPTRQHLEDQIMVEFRKLNIEMGAELARAAV